MTAPLPGFESETPASDGRVRAMAAQIGATPPATAERAELLDAAEYSLSEADQDRLDDAIDARADPCGDCKGSGQTCPCAFDVSVEPAVAWQDELAGAWARVAAGEPESAQACLVGLVRPVPCRRCGGRGAEGRAG